MNLLQNFHLAVDPFNHPRAMVVTHRLHGCPQLPSTRITRGFHFLLTLLPITESTVMSS